MTTHPVDELLQVRHRTLRTQPGRLLLGPSGARLWADVLEPAPGFAGTLDLVHKTNIPLLFRTGLRDGPRMRDDVDALWRPSHLLTTVQFGSTVLVRERRTITWDDVAVSEQVWTNTGSEPVTVQTEIDEEWCTRESDHAWGVRSDTAHGLPVRMAVATSDVRAFDGLVVAPGAEVRLLTAAALSVDATTTELLDRARDRVSTDAVDRAIAEYCWWFDDVPVLETSDPLLDRVWWYRWFILRRNLARPAVGALPGLVVYEGRSHKMTKNPWRPEGWEFSKLIPLSTPMHALELRWRGGGDEAVAALHALLGHQAPDGQLVSGTATDSMHAYANFAGWAAGQVALLHGADRLRDVLPLLAAQVRGEAEHLAGADGLPVQVDHRLTGKEYQPSFWYFTGYPENPMDPAGRTPLKRVDRAVYQYLNARGVAALSARLDPPAAAEFEKIADQLRDSISGKMWDPGTEFFVDLHHQSDARAPVRNVVGFYPWWTDIADGVGPEPLVRALRDPDGFGTPNPVPSTERRNAMFGSGGGWGKLFPKGRNGCMWNGPTWPYTSSVVLDAVGRTSRANGHELDALFAELLGSFVRLHFAGRDGRSPYLVEHYDSLTGEPISDEPDYNHSYLIDLLVRYVAGITVTQGRLTVDPLDVGLDRLSLRGVQVLGRRVDVEWSHGEPVSLVVDGVDVPGLEITLR